MTIAVCVHCGSIKHGAFTNCDSCGARPRSEIDMAYSLALTDHYFPTGTLEQMSEAMRKGQPRPKLPPEQEEHMRMMARQYMTGIGSIIDRAERGEKRDQLRKEAAPLLGIKEKSSALRSRFKAIMRGYLIVGCCLASILFSSYLYPYTLGSWVPNSPTAKLTFGQKCVALIAIQPLAIVAAVPRVFLWGPFLVGWYFYPNGYSLSHWLAPGLYIEDIAPK